MQPNYMAVLKRNKLFDGIQEKEIEKIIACFNAKIVEYKKGETIIQMGGKVGVFGIVLSGKGRTVKYDINGKEYICTLLEEGSPISILLGASKNRVSGVLVQAQTNLAAIFFPNEKMTQTCKTVCETHKKFIVNYLDCVVEMALYLHDRNDCLIQSTVREKVMKYLLRISQEKKTKSFSIPLDRQSMANYLDIERSALSRELSRMKQDGIIDYYKNNFRVMEN